MSTWQPLYGKQKVEYYAICYAIVLVGLLVLDQLPSITVVIFLHFDATVPQLSHCEKQAVEAHLDCNF